MKNQSIKAYIIEDEEGGRDNLIKIIKKFCSELIVVGAAATIAEAVEELPSINPDVVFLDIQLPKENGFKLFDYFPQHDFDVIFTTAYSQYAIKAFNYSAIHYILKPIDIAELQTAIKKLKETRRNLKSSEQYKVWNNVQNNNLSKIVLPTQDGMHFIDTEDIVWCEAKSNYTLFHIIGQDNILVSKSLKTYEAMLDNHSFVRASRSSLINLDHIVHCSTHRKMEITMKDGSVIILSERRKALFKQIFETMGIGTS